MLLAYARRGLKESAKFSQIKREGGIDEGGFFRIWKTPYRGRVLLLALIWSLTYVCTHNAVTFWKDFAMGERGFTDGEVGAAITLAAVVSMPLVFFAGKLLDILGRKRGATVIFVLGATGTWLCYTLEGWWPLTAALTLGIFGASATLPALNAFTTELFPTELRGNAFAWANNLLGRIGYVISPAIIGWAAGSAGA